jgi:hypothetical protein
LYTKFSGFFKELLTTLKKRPEEVKGKEDFLERVILVHDIFTVDKMIPKLCPE